MDYRFILKSLVATTQQQVAYLNESYQHDSEKEDEKERLCVKFDQKVDYMYKQDNKNNQQTLHHSLYGLDIFKNTVFQLLHK